MRDSEERELGWKRKVDGQSREEKTRTEQECSELRAQETLEWSAR